MADTINHTPLTNTDQQLLDYIQQMADDAPGVGLCALPFELLKERVALVIEQKDWLLKHTGSLILD